MIYTRTHKNPHTSFLSSYRLPLCFQNDFNKSFSIRVTFAPMVCHHTHPPAHTHTRYTRATHHTPHTFKLVLIHSQKHTFAYSHTIIYVTLKTCIQTCAISLIFFFSRNILNFSTPVTSVPVVSLYIKRCAINIMHTISTSHFTLKPLRKHAYIHAAYVQTNIRHISDFYFLETA